MYRSNKLFLLASKTTADIQVCLGIWGWFFLSAFEETYKLFLSSSSHMQEERVCRSKHELTFCISWTQAISSILLQTLPQGCRIHYPLRNRPRRLSATWDRMKNARRWCVEKNLCFSVVCSIYQLIYYGLNLFKLFCIVVIIRTLFHKIHSFVLRSAHGTYEWVSYEYPFFSTKMLP